MSYKFPEAPILLYPSLAEQVGVEAAVLMSLYQQQWQRIQSLSSGNASSELVLSRSQWLSICRFWEEDILAQLTSELVEHGLLDATYARDGRVSIRCIESAEQVEHAPMQEPAEELVEMVSRLPVIEAVPEMPAQAEPAKQTLPAETCDTPYYPDAEVNTDPVINPGPAPTFGGSIGWARKAHQLRTGQSDELQAKFRQEEQLRQQLKPMELGWQPSQNFYALLPRHNISIQFAHSCLDEFVLYWLDKDRKETNWDQKFLGWVKREWVRKQTDEGRQQRLSKEQQTGFSNENPRRDTRENRKRVTAAVMDIKDTDW